MAFFLANSAAADARRPHPADSRSLALHDMQAVTGLGDEDAMHVLVDRLLEQVVRWAGSRPDIEAIALVGSRASGRPRPDSDIDLVLITDDPSVYLEDRAWVRGFGEVEHWQEENWGEVTTLRVWYQHGLEVEFGLARTSWARLPVDPGTKRVVADGFRVLLDRTGRLSGLA